MKKELSKKELKEKEIKKAKLIMSLKKVLNIVCYVCTALFMVFCVALGVGSCNNRNKAKQTNNDLIESSQVFDNDNLPYQKSYNRSDLVNDYHTSKSIYDSLFYNYRNQQLNYNVSNAVFWRDVEFGFDIDGLIRFANTDYNKIFSFNGVDYRFENVHIYPSEIQIFNAGFKVHNVVSGNSYSFTSLIIKFGCAYDEGGEFAGTTDYDGVLKTQYFQIVFTGGVSPNFEMIIGGFYYDYNLGRITNIENGNFSNKNYYFTYNFNLYAINRMLIKFSDFYGDLYEPVVSGGSGRYGSFNYFTCCYDINDSDSSEFSLTSTDGAVNSFVDSRESWVLYSYNVPDDIELSIGYQYIDLFDLSFKYLPIQFYHYQLPYTCPNLSDFISEDSFFISNFDSSGVYLIPNVPFYSNGSFYNEMRLDFKHCDMSGSADNIFGFYVYDSSQAKWIYNNPSSKNDGLSFVDSLVFDFWLDWENDINYYYDKVIQLNNGSKIGRNDLNISQAGINEVDNTRLINSYDYYSNGFNDIYLLQIHNFDKTHLINHLDNTIYDNLNLFIVVDSSQAAVSLTDVFDLFKNGFSKLYGFFSWAILPGITLGTLLFMPLIVSIIVIVFRAVKK